MKKRILERVLVETSAALWGLVVAFVGVDLRADVATTTALGASRDEAVEEYVVSDGVKSVDRNVLWGVRAKRLVLPASVETIDLGFHDKEAIFANLEEWRVAERNRFFKSIDGVLFSKDGTQIVNYPPKKSDEEFVVPEGMLKIQCNFNDNLKRLVVPESVEEIAPSLRIMRLEEWRVAEGNSHFKSVDGVLFSKDGTQLLSYPRCKSGSTFVVPNGVQKIADNAFDNAYRLKSVVVPPSVEEVGDAAFANCFGLLSVAFESEPTESQEEASPAIPEDLASAFGVPLTEDKREWKGARMIGDVAFASCMNLVAVELPGSLEEIGRGCFSGCERLTAVGLPLNFFTTRKRESWNRLPRKVKEIKRQTFCCCRSLESIVFPSGMKKMETDAFKGCENLSSVNLNLVEEIADGAFSDVGAELRFSLSDDNPAFKLVDGVLYSKDGATLTLYPSSHKNEEYAVLEGTKKIASGAFARNDSLRCISLPASLEEMETEAFRQCAALERIECSELNAKLKSIDGVLFSKDGAKLLEYPCNKQDAEYSTPEGVVVVNLTTFDGVKALKSLVVSDGAETLERKAPESTVPHAWPENNCLENVSISGSVKVLPECAFFHYRRLKTATFGEGVEEIGKRAFEGCESLESAFLSSSVVKIGVSAFYSCRALKSIEMGAKVQNIDQNAFYGCESLESLSVPASVARIGFSSFANCVSLKSVSIAEGVQEIEETAFYGCKSLESVYIPKSVTKIGRRAFPFETDIRAEPYSYAEKWAKDPKNRKFVVGN